MTIATQGVRQRRVHRAQDVGELAVHAHRVGQPRDADDAGVRGDDQDRAREHARRSSSPASSSGPRPRFWTMPCTGSPANCRSEQRGVVRAAWSGRDRSARGAPASPRARPRAGRRRSRRPPGPRARSSAGRRGPGRAPPRPCSRSSRCPCRRPCRSGSRSGTLCTVGAVPKCTLSTRTDGDRISTDADDHEQRLRGQVGERQEDVQPRRLLDAADVEQRRARRRARRRRRSCPTMPARIQCSPGSTDRYGGTVYAEMAIVTV